MSDALTRRIEQLETQVGRLLHLAGMDRDPFIYLLTEIGVTKEQEKRIHELLNATEKRVRDGLDVDAWAFEMRVGEIMGEPDANHPLADSIVRTCGETHRYDVAVRALKATKWLGND